MAESEVSEIPDLQELVAIFFADLGDLGEFTPVQPNKIPQAYRDLLAEGPDEALSISANSGGARVSGGDLGNDGVS